jgi:hypothetical protein
MESTETVNPNGANSEDVGETESTGSTVVVTTGRKRIPRGLAPPALSLAEAIEVVTRFYEEAGGESSFDLLARITDNSPASSVFAKKVAALRNYNLIEDENRIVRLSPLGFRIAAPHEPAEMMEAAKEAFLNVEIYAKAYDRYKGRILPQDEFLINTFASYVPKELAEEWVEKFKASAHAAGLLEERNGKTQVRETVRIPKEAQEPPPPVELKGGEPLIEERKETPRPPTPSLPNVIRTPLPLGPGRLAYIELPEDWKPSELKKLLRLLALSLGDIEDEEKLGMG